MLAILHGGSLPSAVWLPRTVGEILIRAADINTGRIVFENGTFTCRELLAEAERSAHEMSRGEAIVVREGDDRTFLVALWACFLSGAVPLVLPENVEPPPLPKIGADTALLMRTSGSTGERKLVALSNINIITSVASSAFANQYRPDDVSLNWLPLHHIGGLMRSIREIYVGCTQVQAATEAVRNDPLRWLDLIDEHRATVAWGPNAAFAAVVAQRDELPSRRRWSLDSLRSLHSSGEAVVPRTMKAFLELLAPYGLRAGALRVSWGMTEACFATSSELLDDVGTPAHGVSMRIVGEDGNVLPEGENGRLEIAGPLVASDDWLDTGDLGRISAGRLTISGRSKDVIKIGGVSYANRDIEEVVEAINPEGEVAACGVTDREGESLTIFAEVREELIPEIRARIAEKYGITARFVITLARDQLPRTGIGKIDRRTLRDSFAGGAFDGYRRWPYDLFAARPAPDRATTEEEREHTERIAAIISDVLRVPVGPDDDFFSLGGTSLRVAQAASRIGCALVDLFCAPTPRLLALRLMRPGKADRGRRATRSHDAIAIVGMSCRFPGASDLGAFWKLLTEGREALTEFSEQELLASGISPRTISNPAYVRNGMILDDVETFDADFFGISPRDAETMDPQQRLLLECAWHAMEDAGIVPGAARAGVWIGARLSDYLLFHLPPPDLFGNTEPPAEGFRRVLLNDKDYLATRLAHALNLRGPAVSVQTACSSSLVAVHMACRSLLDSECDIALAGGASLRVPQRAGYLYGEGMIFSPDGRTRPFDATAGGTQFGSGIGIVVLRRLEDALRDGDMIYAVIRGSAINNDGAGPKPAFTAPGHDGQVGVVSDALATAGLDASTISYVEAHGTGTSTGDPIEIAALSEVFSDVRRGSCAVGSVKSNIGHLVQAGGVAGLIKTSLMLRHRMLVPTVNFSEPNPLIDFAASPFYVNTDLRPWENVASPLRAGVSAFGFGGTNAHVILEEAPSRLTTAAEIPRSRILPLSAKSPAALRELATAYATSEEPLRDLCASAQNCRAHLPHRLAIVASSREELRLKLAAPVVAESPSSTRPRIAFVFSGQGAQYAGMGRRVYDTHPAFRRFIDEHSLYDVLFHENVERTEFAQPTLVALQAGLFHLWSEWGIEPDVIVGHSLGEITAAWAAGVLSLRDAVRFASARGRLMERAAPGLMAIAFAPPEQIESRGYDVAIAAVNGPYQTVISGSEKAIEEVLSELRRRGIATRRMPGRYAFHSPLMEPILDQLEAEASHLTTGTPQRAIISTLSGSLADAAFAQPSYWRRQARERVRFHEALETANADVVVQIAPGHDDLPTMFETLGDLYTRGADVIWRNVETEPWQRVALPKYPFQRKRYWIPPRRREISRSGDHPLLGRRIQSPLAEVQFESGLTADMAPFTRDHWIYGARPLVMVGQLEMMRAATGSASAIIENVVVEQALLLGYESRLVQTLVGADGTVRIFSSEDGASWALHTSARAKAAHPAFRSIDLDAIRARCTRELTGEAVFARMEARGADIGPGLKLIQHVWRGDGEVLAEVALDAEASGFAREYVAYPGLLDSFAQCGELTAVDGDPGRARDLFLPTVVDRAVFFDRMPERVWTTLRRRTDSRGDVYGVDGEVADGDGRVLLAIEGFYFKRATPSALTRGETTYEIEWSPFDASPHAIEEGRRLTARSGASAAELCEELLSVVQKMLEENDEGPLWIVTRGAQATGRETAPLSPAQAALWGFGRALQREQPQLRCRLIDLDPAHDAEADLPKAMACAEAEQEIVVRGNQLYGKRLRRNRPHPRSDSSYAMIHGRARTIDELTIGPAQRREPAAGEVEIEVYYTGLNFRDVLNATGRIEGLLGYECSGVVRRCGAGITDFEPGTPVMALAMNSFASHITLDARLVVKKPRNISFAAAATVPVAYVTAMHALSELAELHAGERVLIHTAAGGVGHAAVHVAHAAGAEVVATASRTKRDLVRALGVDTVVDSRATGFAKSVGHADVVLNTLGNEFTAENVRVLRPGGRLLELGHADVIDMDAITRMTEAAKVKFINFHIAQDVAPDHLQQLLTTLAESLASGRLPVLPVRCVELADVRQAFETMLRGAHVGKIAIMHPAAENAELQVDDDATYLITGGSGAVGTRIAQWLIQRGAKHLVLLSRRSKSPALDDRAEVRTLHADVADEEALSAALAMIASTMPPLRGVIHAAGVLDDGIVTQQTPERLRRVLAPKIDGAWNLHRATESIPLDFFVLISSVAGLWGNGGQTTYAAANAFLDQLAHYRRQLGLPATSVDYGAWSGSGMASTLPDSARRRRAQAGAADLDPDLAVRALESALAKARTQVAVFAGAVPQLAESTNAAPEMKREGQAPRSLEDSIGRTRRRVSELCGAPTIDIRLPLPELGLDSLSVLLLRGRLITEFGDAAALPVIRFLEGHSVEELASMIHDRVKPPLTSRPQWTSLTPIKPEGKRAPVILVPPAVRTAALFNTMAATLNGDRPVFGLNPIGLDGMAAPHDSIEAMATDYLREIRSAWPNGPYILGGACFGGLVAWEMTRQLRGEGVDVPLLILLDTAAPDLVGLPRSESFASAIERGFGWIRARANAVSMHLRQRDVHRWIAARLRDEPFDIDEHLHRAVRAHAAALKNYRAPVLDADVLLVQSSEYRVYGACWRRLVRGSLKTVLVPGTKHVDILSEAAAPEVTKVISDRLAALSS